MKKLILIFSLGLISSALFAAETSINCDDLARHIEHKIATATHISGTILKLGAHAERSFLQVSFRDQFGFYCTKGCREAGIEKDFKAINALPAFIKLFEQYHNALKKCSENSEASCQKASAMMRVLQQEIELYTQCMALFNEEVAKGSTIDTFIGDANK